MIFFRQFVPRCLGGRKDLDAVPFGTEGKTAFRHGIEPEGGNALRKRPAFHRTAVSGSLSVLKIRLTVTFLILVIIPVSLISAAASFLYRRTMNAKVQEIVNNSTLQSIQTINERLDIYRNLLYEVVTDQNVIATADRLNGAVTELDKAYGQQSMTNSLSGHVSATGYCTGMVFLSDFNYAAYDKTRGSSESIWDNAKYRQMFLSLCRNRNTVTYLSGADIQPSGQSRLNGLVYLGFPLSDLVTKKFYGVIVLSLDSSIFRYNTAVQNGQKQLTAWAGIQSVVVSEKNSVISTWYGNTPIPQTLNDYSGEDSRTVVRTIPNSGWNLVSIIDEKVLFGEINRTEQWVFVLTIFTCLLFLLLLIFTMNRMERSVIKIADGIQNYIPGKASIDVDLNPGSEFYVIIRKFNETASRNNQLIEELKDRNLKIAEETDKHRKAELKALEAQINPHFIYNVLDSINWMAIDGGKMEISRMLTSLGSILRYSSTNIDIVVALQAEIEWMQKYVFLQQERYGNTFVYQCEAEEAAMGFPIYKMLLQPIAENAIQHGFEGVHSGGVLKLSAHMLPGGLVEIRVKDNGCGIDEKTLKKIRGQIDGTIPIDGSAIGISNVINRIRMYYSSEAAIGIESGPGEGTEVTLILPACGSDGEK